MTVRQLPSLSAAVPRTWVVASACAVVVVGVSLSVSAAQPALYRTVLACGYLAVLGWLAVNDLRTLRAPNAVVLPAIVAAIVLSIPLGAGDFIAACAGGLIAFWLLFVVAILGRGAMGFGDVKVGAIAGLAVGLHAVLMMLLLTFGMGASFAAVALFTRIRSRKDVVAFTPFLAIAVAICFVLGGTHLTR